MAFAYEPVSQDELQLVLGETIEIVKEVRVPPLFIAAQTLAPDLLITRQWRRAAAARCLVTGGEALCFCLGIIFSS